MGSCGKGWYCFSIAGHLLFMIVIDQVLSMQPFCYDLNWLYGQHRPLIVHAVLRISTLSKLSRALDI